MEIDVAGFRKGLKAAFTTVDYGGDVLIRRGSKMYKLVSADVHKDENVQEKHVHKAVGYVIEGTPDKIEKITPVGFDAAKIKRITFYGCGCKKEDGELMCSKHSRL